MYIRVIISIKTPSHKNVKRDKNDYKIILNRFNIKTKVNLAMKIFESHHNSVKHAPLC